MTRFSEDTGGAVFPGDTGAIRLYFDVDDINAGVAQVKELGGSGRSSARAVNGLVCDRNRY